jgi:hypothetical protein
LLTANALCIVQLGDGIGICPVTVGAVVVKTIAAKPVAAVCAAVKMRFAEILLTDRT